MTSYVQYDIKRPSNGEMDGYQMGTWSALDMSHAKTAKTLATRSRYTSTQGASMLIAIAAFLAGELLLVLNRTDSKTFLGMNAPSANVSLCSGPKRPRRNSIS
jgi:hypothetical protein